VRERGGGRERPWGEVNHGSAATLPQKSLVTEKPYQQVVATPTNNALAPRNATEERNAGLPARALSGRTTEAAATCQELLVIPAIKDFGFRVSGFGFRV